MVTSQKARILRQYRDHLGAGRASLAQLIGGRIEVRSEGGIVVTDDGSRLLDCGGYGVFLLGHRHPTVVAAVAEQLGRHPMSSRILIEPTLATAAADLARVSPAPLQYVYFVNSGAEATETALKLARLHGRKTVICAEGGFHGKTLGALSVTPRAQFQEPFQPLLSGITVVPYGDLEAMAAALAAAPDSAVVLEPIQGEGGVNIPPAGYLRAVRQLCDRHGALLIIDEIQTGLGRTGRWWAHERDGITPDIMLVGKGLSGGVVPVGAVVATPAAFAPLGRDPFVHTSTFGGSPLAMAAVSATVAVLETEDLIARSAAVGAIIVEQFREIVARSGGNLISEVRGSGLLIGIECRTPHAAVELFLAMLEQNVLVNHSLNSHTVVRLTPPAILDDAQLDWLSAAFDKAVQQLCSLEIAGQHLREGNE
ncbi:aspartate aminotransferase family protein [Jidongwangia harbinensis]|uniref:aspartate aminotransferase family protein n=1 Tax=Jidongwangia harbinensis TaxID=2878561 RepID=UPI001CD99DA3|nr:aminotransferase class III-fold pyridoxal phosphate-dependent enzyme [Jidongwangia harbinensis]MCA2212157.1 aminotransferase class III-fold pyridoxal phosphate-dependent enzyme [Jidongwangia harbinensis]